MAICKRTASNEDFLSVEDSSAFGEWSADSQAQRFDRESNLLVNSTVCIHALLQRWTHRSPPRNLRRALVVTSVRSPHIFLLDARTGEFCASECCWFRIRFLPTWRLTKRTVSPPFRHPDTNQIKFSKRYCILPIVNVKLCHFGRKAQEKSKKRVVASTFAFAHKNGAAQHLPEKPAQRAVRTPAAPPSSSTPAVLASCVARAALRGQRVATEGTLPAT